MCTLHLFFQVFAEAPVLFAANRDELLDRPWEPPTLLAEHPWVLGPRDVLAGGTWLGVNERGVLAALANHEGTLRRPQAASFCSRGLVVLEALKQGTAEEAAVLARDSAPACKSYTLLLADATGAFVVERTPKAAAVHRLPPGCHVVTNARFRSPGDLKALRALRRMGELSSLGHRPDVEELRGLLADHGMDGPGVTPVCTHPVAPPYFGTSSASVILVEPGNRVRFLFAPGPPCSRGFRDVAQPLETGAAPLAARV